MRKKQEVKENCYPFEKTIEVKKKWNHKLKAGCCVNNLEQCLKILKENREEKMLVRVSLNQIRKVGKRLFLFFSLILGTIGLTCSMSMEESYYMDTGLEGYGRLGRFLVKLGRSMSSNFLLNNIVAVLLVILLFLVGRSCFCMKEKVFAFLFSLLFSLLQLVSMAYTNGSDWSNLYMTGFLKFRSLCVLIGYTMLCSCIVLLTFRFLDRLNGMVKAEEERSNLADRQVLKKKLLAVSLFLFFCWLPYLIVFAPGTASVDTSTMIAQFFNIKTWAANRTAATANGEDVYVTTHFSYFLTVIYSWFIKFGMFLGNASYGVLLHSVLQMAAMVVEFAATWLYLYKIGLRRKFVKVGILFTAFFPYFPLCAICMLKDVPFSMSCLALTVLICEVIRTKGQVFQKKLFCVGIGVDIAFLLLTRRQGIYFMYLIIPLLFVLFHRYWKQILLSVLLPVVLFLTVWSSLLLPAFGVATASKEAALGPLFQQTARYVYYFSEDVTEEEREAIDGVLDYDKLAEKYNPILSDPVKRTYNLNATSEELAAYFKAWWSMFLKHPGCYVQAILANCYIFFDMKSATGPIYFAFNNGAVVDREELCVEMFFAGTQIQNAASALMIILRKLPFFRSAFYVWVVAFFYLDRLRKGDYFHLVTGIVALLSIAILIISPANGNIRYAYPVIFTAPFLFCLCMVPTAHGVSGAMAERDFEMVENGM